MLLAAALACAWPAVAAGPAEPVAAPTAGSPPDADGDKVFDSFETRLAKASKGTRLDVIVSLDGSATPARVSSLERSVGVDVTRRFKVIDAVAAKGTPAQILALTRQGLVEHVEEDLPVRAFNDTAQESFGVTKVHQDSPDLDGSRDGDPNTYSKDDLVAAVIDTGIDAGHDDLDEGKVLAFVNCFGKPCAPEVPFDDNGHGTHVAATLAGDGDGRPDHRYRGVAPGAALVGVKVLNGQADGSLSDITAGIDWVVANKATYGIEAINISLGAAGCENSLGTDATSQAVNAAVAAGIVVSAAAGNSGPAACTIGTPAGAADAITVGAMADTGVNGAPGPGFYQAFFSSRGPTIDGRTKPDISGPGVNITSAAAGTSSDYVMLSGTSMSSPFVAGVTLLMLDADPTLSPAKVKQLLMTTAVDWGPPGTDGDYGAGRLDAYAAVDAANGAPPLGTPPGVPSHLLFQGNLVAPGDEVEYLLDLPTTQFPLAATLISPSWSAGTPDADLELVAPDGAVVIRADTTLRQDQFGVQVTTPGIYRLRVRSFAGSGPFFVDVSGAQVPASAPFLGSGTAVVSDAVAIGGDGDGALEPGEPFTLQQQVKNRGTAAATGVGGTLSPTAGGVTLTQGVSQYGSIAPGGAATNLTPFAGTVGSGSSCGRPVTLSLALASDQGPTTVPVTLQTGAPAATVRRTSLPAVAIPDDGSTVSTLDVPAAGVVKDVDVLLGEVRHTWDADLSFVLTSPAGTSVLLVNRRGGSGDDFLGTVLDDEATTKVYDGVAPFSGHFRPEQPLSAFDGEQQQGLWTLKVTDHAIRDVGTLNSWGTDLSKAVCDFAAPPAASVADLSASEGDSGTTGATFTVVLDKPSVSTVTVDYATADGTAVAPADYAARTGTLTFAPGETTETVTVDVSGDDLDEPAESFSLELSNAVNVHVLDGAASGTIVDDDDSPVAQPQNLAVDEDGSTPVTLAATDADSGTLGYVVGTPGHGALSGTAPNLVYTPAADYHGGDSFTFTASDGTNGSGTASVAITVNPVNDAPVAVDDSGTTRRNEATDVAVLANDTDVDSDSLIVTGVTQPAHGTAAVQPDGTVGYTPHDGYVGSDSFAYTAGDGHGGADTANVAITVAAGSPPTATADAYSIDEDAQLTVSAPGVLANDTDADADSLTAVQPSAVSHGALTLNPNGSLTYTPPANFNGVVTFSYRADDGVFTSDAGTVTITVRPVNDAPSSRGDAYATGHDQALVVGAPGVLANDADVENTPLTAALTAGPSGGSVALNANGSFTYTPGSGFSGTDTFRYRASDGDTDSGVATVTITVAEAPPAPPQPPTPPTSPPPPVPRGPKAGIASGQVRVTAAGLAAVELSCAKKTCHGTVTLEYGVNVKPDAVRRPAKKLVLGRRVFTLRAGQRKAVNVRLNRVAMKLLRQRRKLRAKAIVSVVGGKPVTRTVTLSLAPRRVR